MPDQTELTEQQILFLQKVRQYLLNEIESYKQAVQGISNKELAEIVSQKGISSLIKRQVETSRKQKSVCLFSVLRAGTSPADHLLLLPGGVLRANVSFTCSQARQ